MAIHVTTTNLIGATFDDATGWHIDEAGYLHVTKTGHGNVASFHASAWVSAEKVAEADK